MWWSAWESVSEVDLERGAGRGPGAVFGPFGVGAHDGEVDELGGGLFVGEVPAGLDRLADLAVQALDRVGGVDRAAELVGQAQERDHVLPAGAPGVDGRGVAPAPLGVEALELDERGVGVGGGVDRAQRRGDLLAVAVVDVAQRGADEVHDAGLHPRGREDGFDRLGEALEPVDAADQDVLDATAAEIVEDGQPELGALGLLPPDPEDLALAIAGHAQSEVAGAVLDRAVLADLHEQRVEVDDRIDALQRPGAPRGDVLQDGVGDPADRVAPDVDAVELGQVRGDITDAHAAGVEVEHPVIQARQAGLALAHQLRLERPGAVARRAYLDRPEVGGDRLGRVAVSDVAGPARGRLPGRIAQVAGQLGTQRRLEHPAGELAHQAARPGDLLGPKPLQRVVKGVVGQQPREAIANLLNRTLVSGGPRRPIPTELDLLHGHGWLSRPQGPRRSPRPHTEHRTDPHVKQVPGRKTDVSDAAWLCRLAEAGLLKASFVPPKPIRQLRNLTRYRKTQIQERAREVNRLHK